jgi:hypothetical protein
MRFHAFAPLALALAITGCATTEEAARKSIELGHSMPAAACPAADHALRKAFVFAEDRRRAAAAGLGAREADDQAIDRGRERAGALLGQMLGMDPSGKAAAAGASTSVVIEADALFEEMTTAQDAMQRKSVATALSSSAKAADSAGLYPLYFTDYFRRGRLFSVVVSPDDAKKSMRKQVLAALNLDDGKLTDDQKKVVDDAVAALMQAICKDAKCTILDETGEGAFVNRAGQKFAFPAVAVSIVPGSDKPLQVTKMDEIQVVGDLARVLWEASFDTLMFDLDIRPYADAKASACALDRKERPFDCVPNDAPKGDQDALAKLNLIADRTEGVAGAVAAKLVRGGWIASLNNEAIAKFLQTTIAVAFRKAAEIVMTANRLYCKAAPTVPLRRVTLRITP